MQKLHKKFSQDEDNENMGSQEDDSTNQEFRRLKNKLINDTRINNPTDSKKPFKTEFVKSSDALSAYLKNKQDDPVEVNY